MESVSDILTHFIFNVNNKLNINEDTCSVNLSSYMNPKVQNGPERARTDVTWWVVVLIGAGCGF